MSAYQNKARETVFSLFLTNGNSAPTVLYSDVTVQIRKQGESAFTTKTIASADWINLGNGHYAIKWSTEDMDTLGAFLWRITGSGLSVMSGSFDVDPAPLTVDIEAPLCIVSGNVANISGGSARQEVISFRPMSLPKRIGTSLLSGDLVRTTTDAFGNFSVALLRSSKVLVEIERAGIKYKIDVPDAETADLIDLLPPLS